MNILFIIALIGIFIFGVLLFNEIFKKPKQSRRPMQPKQQQQPQPQPMAQPIRQKQPYQQVYSQLSKEIQVKQEQMTPQARHHTAIPREAMNTVDTSFEQAKTKMWGLNPLKQPVEPETYDLKKDTTMFWNRKLGSLYILACAICLVLLIMMGV